MKLFLLLIPFLCITEISVCPAKKLAAVKKEEVKKTAYQYPSVLIFSIN